MMTRLRESTAIIMWIVIIAFIGLIVVEWGADYSGTSQGGGSGNVGVINGEEISLRTFQNAMKSAARQRQADAPRDNATIIREVWDAMLGEILLRQEVARLGIELSDEELAYFTRNAPPAAVQALPTFQRDGKFDPALYQQFITDRTTYEDAKASAFVLQIEAMTRSQLLSQRLQALLLETVRVSPQEVRQQFNDQNDKVSVDYVFVAATTVPDQDVVVGEDEILAKYNEMSGQFHHPEQIRVAAVLFPRLASAQDSADVANEIQRLRDEIVTGGADFADMAVAVSEDEGSAAKGGDLGTFGRGSMVPAFEDVAFALQSGEVSQPVETRFGWHLIKVEQIVEEEGETQIHARHILLKYAASPETDDDLLEAAEAFRGLAQERGFEAAAQIEGIEVRDAGYVARGQTLAGLGVGTQWVVSRFFDGSIGDISPVGSLDGGYYVAVLTDRRDEGTATLEEVRARVERMLHNDKRAEMAGETLRSVRANVTAGEDFGAAAVAAGLEVRQSGPFARVDFVPGVGRGSAFTGAAFKLQPGQVSEVVVQSSGAYLLHLTDRDSADEALFVEQREAIEAQLLDERRREALQTWYAQLYDGAEIKDYRHNFYSF